MSSLDMLLSKIIIHLNNSPNCLSVEITESTIFPNSNFVIKIRAKLIKKCILQVRIYHNKGHYDYSYQLYNGGTIARWDNKEDFPELSTFPHHFHSKEGIVKESNLQGDPLKDFPLILHEIEKIVALI